MLNIMSLKSSLSLHLGEGEVAVSLIILHPKFNVTGLRDKNIMEFYDYDVAIVKLASSIKLSNKAR